MSVVLLLILEDLRGKVASNRSSLISIRISEKMGVLDFMAEIYLIV